MKRIAMFASCDSFEGFYGGTFGLDRATFLSSYRNDFIWEYSKGLILGGHIVTIYLLSYGLPGLNQIEEGLAVRFLPLPPWLRYVDALLFRMRKLPYAQKWRDYIAWRGYEGALRSALRDDQVDLLYHQEIWTSRFDILLDALDLPIIGADHGAVFAEWMSASKSKAFPRATKVICQSSASLERALSFGGSAVQMHNGVDTTFFAPSTKPRSRTSILAVGRFVESQKRFADLLVALQSLPEFSLTLAGSGPDAEFLKSRAQQLGVASRVTFAGFVSSRAELRRLYQSCAVFVSTSKWEAVALVMLEAMSCEAAVVATRIPSFEELITNGVDGLLVPLASPAQLANAITEAATKQSDFGKAGRQTVLKRYSSKLLYEHLSALIDHL